jgi:carbon monoxide dehydrogenase subunit G
MVRFESSTSIARPVNDVFDYVSDVRNDPNWHTDVLEASTAGPGPIGSGTVFNTKFKPFMGKSEGTMTVSEYEPPTRTVLKGRLGKMAPTITYSFAAEGSGTRLTRRVEVDPPGIMRIMAPLMKPMMGKQNAGFLANLKRVLESR